MKKYKNTPASGEQRDVSGFEFQYEVSAYLILKSLKEKKLKWVKFIDPQAGRVDDFQINTSGTINAYQIKKSSSQNYISFTQVLSSSKGHSIINQLANGWKQLKSNHAEDIKVWFLTNMSPSRNDRLFERDNRRKTSFHRQRAKKAKARLAPRPRPPVETSGDVIKQYYYQRFLEKIK